MSAKNASGNQNAAAPRRDERARRAARILSRRDPRLGALIRRIGPHRPVLMRDCFQTLAYSIIQQQVSMSAAAAIRKRVAALCPRNRMTPQAIHGLDERILRSAGLSRQKAAYIRDLAAHFASGALSNRKLRTLDDEGVIQTTTRVKGIGRWTAEMLLMFCLERPDVWPIDDLGLRKAVRNFTGRGDFLNPAEMIKLAEPWRPYRTYASWYLWRSLEGPLMPGMSVV